MAAHSSILAWRTPWTGEPGRLQSMVSQNSDMTQRLNHQPPPPWLTHVDVWQKPTQFCKAIIRQLNKNIKSKKKTVPQKRKQVPASCTHWKHSFDHELIINQEVTPRKTNISKTPSPHPSLPPFLSSFSFLIMNFFTFPCSSFKKSLLFALLPPKGQTKESSLPEAAVKRLSILLAWL